MNTFCKTGLNSPGPYLDILSQYIQKPSSGWQKLKEEGHKFDKVVNTKKNFMSSELCFISNYKFPTVLYFKITVYPDF